MSLGKGYQMVHLQCIVPSLCNKPLAFGFAFTVKKHTHTHTQKQCFSFGQFLNWIGQIQLPLCCIIKNTTLEMSCMPW